jgi:hypothetical protein
MSSPPIASAYHLLDASLRETLERSFEARELRPRGATWILDDGKRLAPDEEASQNLANAFWGASPASVWEALQLCGAEWVSMLVRVHERMRAIDPTLGLWRQIKYVRNGWWGGSGGFKVVYFDPAEMRRALAALAANRRGKRVARDTLLGSLEHQLESSVKVLTDRLLSAPRDLLDPDAEPPDALTYREVDRPGEEGLHFCVGVQDLRPSDGGARHVKLDDIHLDWKSPVAGVGPGGTCQYTGMADSVQHWMQAMLHVAKPTFFFHETDLHLNALRDGRRPLPAALCALRDALEAEWRSVRFTLAVQGKAGLVQAAIYWSRAGAIAKKLPPAR